MTRLRIPRRTTHHTLVLPAGLCKRAGSQTLFSQTQSYLAGVTFDSAIYAGPTDTNLTRRGPLTSLEQSAGKRLRDRRLRGRVGPRTEGRVI